MDLLLTTLSGKQIAEKIRSGAITSREAVEAHIDHIKKVNPAINAVVKDRFATARREADHADRILDASKGINLPPYHGVPCTIKEAYALKGMPHTSGHVARKGITAKNDATAVARIRKAGAIPLGVTNIPELCMWMECHNRVYGRTRNPYDPRRIPGGSSGGEGAIIGAGGSPFGLGSDIGGSIRFPAFCNGVFGHKPTGGLVPGTGHFPLAENDARRYCTFGVLSRRAEDLMPLISILAGPDGEDPSCTAFKLGNPSKVSLKGRQVIYIESNGRIKPTKKLKLAQRKCADQLEKQGALIREPNIKKLNAWITGIYLNMLEAETDTPFEMILGGGKPINMASEIIKMLLQKSVYTLPGLYLAILERLNKPMQSIAKKYIEKGKALKAELISLIGPDGLMLHPSYPIAAPYHHTTMLTANLCTGFMAMFNFLEFPVTQVPLGLDDDGLPLGAQVAALPGNDHMTIAAAMELERAFGGWVPPWEKKLP